MGKITEYAGFTLQFSSLPRKNLKFHFFETLSLLPTDSFLISDETFFTARGLPEKPSCPVYLGKKSPARHAVSHLEMMTLRRQVITPVLKHSPRQLKAHDFLNRISELANITGKLCKRASGVPPSLENLCHEEVDSPENYLWHVRGHWPYYRRMKGSAWALSAVASV